MPRAFTGVMWVGTGHPGFHGLSVTWKRNGTEIPGTADSRNLELSKVAGLAAGDTLTNAHVDRGRHAVTRRAGRGAGVHVLHAHRPSVGGTVPATLSLALGTIPPLGPFTAGLGTDHFATIGSSDPLRTGTYAKTLTFTLSTTNP